MSARKSDAQPYPTCIFVQAKGVLCACPALKGHSFCRHHNTQAVRERNRARTMRTLQFAALRAEYLALEAAELLKQERFRDLMQSLNPDFSDRESIRSSLLTVSNLRDSGELARREAGLLIYAFQIAAFNLNQCLKESRQTADPSLPSG